MEAVRNVRTIASLNAEDKFHKMYEEELLSKLTILDKSNNRITLLLAVKFAVNLFGFLINIYCGRIFVAYNYSTKETFTT